MTTDNIIARVRKLLALADSESEIGNVDAASSIAAQATEMLLRHGLSMADVDASVREVEDPLADESVTTDHAKARPWLSALAHTIDASLGTYNVQCRDYDAERECFVLRRQFYGRRSAASTAAYLYAYLVHEIDAWAKKHAMGRGKTYAASYRLGMVRTIGARLAEMREHVVDSASQSGALVLVNASKEAKRYAHSVDSIRTARASSSRVEASGLAAGSRDGERVQLRVDSERGLREPARALKA